MFQQSYHPNETIAAVATPPGEGGVAIIRIAGEGAVAVADAVFSRDVSVMKSHRVYYGSVVDVAGSHVDDVLLLPMLGSRSFTGEDTVEIHCHGGVLITRKVLETIIAAGARQALPGEFAYKAFMNGKIDLAQAEAIQALIAAKNEHAMAAAEEQLRGVLSAKVRAFQSGLTDAAAILEAWVDFPEEGLEFTTEEQLCEDIEAVLGQIEALIKSYHDGRIVQDGIALCLAGSPNVGKSSLMNALLDRERAIVSDTPGTTRDLVEDYLRINGLNFRVTDTAGIREAIEAIEKEGIRRTKKAMEEADLILLVLDAAQGVSGQERRLIEELPMEKTVIVWNKCDLPHEKLPELSPHQVVVSAKERSGFDKLHQMIDTVIWAGGAPSHEGVLITNVRHKEALEAAASACSRVIEGLKEGVSPEFLSADLRSALIALGKIIGADVVEDVLSAIFSKFCVGK